ncbi:Gfo/Idh/MocA family protein [Paenibacillus koleovorans]|uniref:Gfo/Idh/MocA family protein n=1 Tax=Paenibacillus koleovorans TaxID=121608 RepID=UPI000FDC07B0|nr:Gfo/Idh/MocA family oxidoreductase [Paenibacillus koleovorans]
MSRIKIAVVGLNFGRHMLQSLSAADRGKAYFEIAAVCDVFEEKARTIAEQYGVKAYFALDDLLQDREIEAVALFTGPAGRAELIGRIIAAGKHVMTTKPFETDAAQALEILQRAKRAGRIVHMNSPSPVLPADLRQIKDWIREHNLGQLIGCRCDVWANYREKADGKWYDDPNQCPVAPIFRLGIYLINDLVQLFGNAKQVQVMHSRMFTERPTPDNAQLGILFENGAIGNIYASFCIGDGQSYKNSMLLNFERGTISRNIEPLEADAFNGVSHLSLITKDAANKSMIERRHVSADLHGNYQWDVFYKAIQGDRMEEDVYTESIVEGIQIITAMARAEKSGRLEEV